jgi:hypothetical protein
MTSLFAEKGFLQLIAIAGSTPLYIAAATISTELRLVDVSVSQQLASSIFWTSDSCIVFLLPPGAGPNQTVGVQASGQSSNVLGGLSYPLPQIQPTKISDIVTTGTASIQIVGRYFSYRSATVSVRLASTSCSSSTWISDVSVMCRNAAGGGSLRGIVASVDFLHSEMISTGNSASGPLHIPFVFVENVLKSAMPWMVQDSALFTGGMQVIILGEKYGVIDVSFGMRIGVSSSCATLWFSDTSIINRVGQRSNGVNTPFILSAKSRHVGAKLAPDPQSLSFQIMSVTPRNIPRTGSCMLTLLGSHFALHPTSAAIRTGYSSHELSTWHADSIIQCKTIASGFDFHSHILLSVVQISPLLAVPYETSFSTSPLRVSSALMPFPSNMLEDFGLVYLVTLLGEHFGASNSIDVVELDSKSCWPLLWTSDSSLICSVPTMHFESNRVKVSLESHTTNEVTFYFENESIIISCLTLCVRFLWHKCL